MAGLSFAEVMKWTDGQCRDYLEARRWPDGPFCPKCGTLEPYTINRKSRTKNNVTKLYRCKSCRRDFTATVGTIFEDSKIPLSQWFAAIYLMCSSKKGISAHQIHRTLGVTYKSAWFMCHRVREAMRDKGPFEPLSGNVEADETYIGGKPRGHTTWKQNVTDEVQMGLRANPPHRAHPRFVKQVVFGMVERGGKVRTQHVGTGDVVSRKRLNRSCWRTWIPRTPGSSPMPTALTR